MLMGDTHILPILGSGGGGDPDSANPQRGCPDFAGENPKASTLQ